MSVSSSEHSGGGGGSHSGGWWWRVVEMDRPGGGDGDPPGSVELSLVELSIIFFS